MNPSTPGNWHKVSTSITNGIPREQEIYLWYNLGKTMSNLSNEEKQNIITELDVQFGDDRPWYGFDELKPPVKSGEEGRFETSWLTYRRGVKGT